MNRNFFFALLLLVTPYGSTLAQPSNWEWNYLLQLEANRTTSRNHFYQTISSLSNPIALAIPATCITFGLLKDKPSLKQKGIYIASSFAANVVATHLLKTIVNRKRPAEAYPTFIPVVHAGSRSFPSGHTSEAFSMATSLSLSFPKWYVIAPAFAYATGVGYSRMYLGVHYPSDVIAGAILGTASAWCMYKVNKFLDHKKRAKKQS